MQTESNQPTILDLLRPIRARFWVIIVMVAVAVAVAVAFSLTEKKQYSAVASYQFQDQAQALSLEAVPVPASLTPAQLASQAAQTILQPNVLARVKALLRSPLAESQLASSVTASVDPNSSNVDVLATTATPRGAAAVANAFATAAVQIANQAQRAQYRADAVAVAKQRVPKTDLGALTLQQEEVARLNQLASIAAPAQVTATATPPGAPSSPKPARNAVIAGLLGLMLGILVVYTWDSLDRRLRSANDIERQFGYPLVGSVREAALGHSPNVADRHRAVDPIDWEQFRILRRNVEFLGPNGGPRMIAVTSAMPEEGKTTVASFVAFASAAAGRRTLLIECDLRRPVLANRLGLQHAPGVTDFVNGAAEPADLLQLVKFDDVAVANGASSEHAESDKPGPPVFRHEFVCVTAGSPTDYPVEVLESPAFRTMLEEVKTAYDLVILDTPPVLPVVDTLEVINNTEAIVVCGREDKLTRDQARAGRRALERAPGQIIALVVTGVSGSGPDYGYYSYYGAPRSQ